MADISNTALSPALIVKEPASSVRVPSVVPLTMTEAPVTGLEVVASIRFPKPLWFGKNQ